METETKNASWLQKPIRSYIPEFNVEVVIIILIILLAFVSRFTILGERVMSHDEINHVIPSWDLFQGRGYVHDPVTHGPLQFHLVALSYFIFGDSDFSSRVPAAFCSVAAIIFVMFAFRRYLGRIGALVASFMFLISPFMLYYGRYTRNEAFLELIGVISLYAILRYLDKGESFSLILLTISTALHFTIKETSYIFIAMTLIFVFVLFVEQVLRKKWEHPEQKQQFLYLVIFIILMFALVFGAGYYESHVSPSVDSLTETVAETVTETVEIVTESTTSIDQWTITRYISAIALAIGVVAAFAAIMILFLQFGMSRLKEIRAFNLLMLQGLLVLPTLAAFVIQLVGWDPRDYTSAAGHITEGQIHILIVVGVLIIISSVVGALWDSRKWLINAIIFFTISIIFYTAFFTNAPAGFLSGYSGGLGYWLSQQNVQRGGQPLYYYALVQIPIYEFLPAIGVIMAFVIGLSKRLFSSFPGTAPAAQKELINPDETQRVPTLALLVYWTILSLIAYSIAGEKMPWITVHIALPMILTAGWGIGYFIETYDWTYLKKTAGWQNLLIIVVAIYAAFASLNALIQETLPFSGKEIDQLDATYHFLFALVLLLISMGAIVYRKLSDSNLAIGKTVLLVFLVLAVGQTVRASYMSSFINYDNAKEYLVYAHAASGPKEVFSQIEEISRRITGGKDLDVAYDNDVNYPYWWYLRDYPNKLYYADQPSREVGQKPLIAAGDSTMNNLGPIIKNNYIEYSYMRLWWPNQDYWNLSKEKLGEILTNRNTIRGIFNIWLNRDYTDYAEATGNINLTLEQWEPSSKMKFFIRKDIAAQIWDYGVIPENVLEEVVDPYENYYVNFTASSSFGFSGSEPGQFSAPRDIAIAADDSIYVADSQNHRIQHFNADGSFIEAWGSFSGNEAEAAVGYFNEPWGVAVGPDGSVYVTDTWNHRVQKFDAHGKFLTTWGYFGQAETGDAFWGPRDIAVDEDGFVYVADTGNKRIVIFDADGVYINQFGIYGFSPGEFDEPVGVAVDKDGKVFVTDTWNQRIQVFTASNITDLYTLDYYWDVAGWYGQSLENKPFIAISNLGDIFITDPEGPRIIQFTNAGEIIRLWGDYSADLDGFGLASGVAIDSNNNILVTDGSKNRILRFDLASLLGE
ncbi:MAG: glycosyltransferase family 39 protein [Anaerolineaceae bacterium]|nr:glycosyltransferase family 39 protein [Anaerolineaceae bacterium]